MLLQRNDDNEETVSFSELKNHLLDCIPLEGRSSLSLCPSAQRTALALVARGTQWIPVDWILWPPDVKSWHMRRPWCWERLRAGEGGGRGRDGWMASPTQQTRVWENSGRQWRTGKPGVLQSLALQSIRPSLATEQQKALHIHTVEKDAVADEDRLKEKACAAGFSWRN